MGNDMNTREHAIDSILVEGPVSCTVQFRKFRLLFFLFSTRLAATRLFPTNSSKKKAVIRNET